MSAICCSVNEGGGVTTVGRQVRSSSVADLKETQGHKIKSRVLYAQSFKRE